MPIRSFWSPRSCRCKMIEIRNLSKSFTLHNQGSAVIPVMQDAALHVAAGECVGLIVASGAGKSTLMRMVWGHYLAASLLARLNIPERLWSLSPTTFSGGEQQRVNIARGFAHGYPALLLDEPTASLDEIGRAHV